MHLLPAGELLLGEAELLAVEPRVDPAPLLGVLVHGEALHPLEGPGARAVGSVGQTDLLNVQREDGELRGCEAACNKNDGNGVVISWSSRGLYCD